MKDSDRRRQLAHDGIDPDDGGETIPPALAMQLQQFAKGKMSDADFSEFVELLGNLSGVSLSTDEILGPEETAGQAVEAMALTRGGIPIAALMSRKRRPSFASFSQTRVRWRVASIPSLRMRGWFTRPERRQNSAKYVPMQSR